MLTKLSTPTVRPVTLEETKTHLRVTHDAEDVLIAGLIDAAVEWVETATGRSLLTTRWKLTCETWPDDRLDLPRSPVQQVDWIFYTDEDDVTQTVDRDVYYVGNGENVPAWIELVSGQSWPTHKTSTLDAVRIEWTAGYGDDGSCVPARVRQCVKLLVGHWYENREGVITGTIAKPLDLAIDSLLRTVKTGTVAGADL